MNRRQVKPELNPVSYVSIQPVLNILKIQSRPHHVTGQHRRSISQDWKVDGEEEYLDFKSCRPSNKRRSHLTEAIHISPSTEYMTYVEYPSTASNGAPLRIPRHSQVTRQREDEHPSTTDRQRLQGAYTEAPGSSWKQHLLHPLRNFLPSLG
jgi:hypothetical protein